VSISSSISTAFSLESLHPYSGVFEPLIEKVGVDFILIPDIRFNDVGKALAPQNLNNQKELSTSLISFSDLLKKFALISPPFHPIFASSLSPGELSHTINSVDVPSYLKLLRYLRKPLSLISTSCGICVKDLLNINISRTHVQFCII
jgi:hypothetical protein